MEWSLGDLAGKVVVLKFWATWCGPCIAEFPHFVKLLEKYEDDDEVVFLTVATAGSPREGVAELLSENGGRRQPSLCASSTEPPLPLALPIRRR